MQRARNTSILLISLLALACCLARPAAAGINLSWNDCGAFGTSSTPLTCTSNLGSLLMIVSATPTETIAQALTQETVIDIVTSGATLSPWWDMRASGGCRPLSLSVFFSFEPLANCADPWSGQALGGYDYAIAPIFEVPYWIDARIRTVCALPAHSPVVLEAGTEYYMCEIIINKAKTVGLGSCAGCTDDGTFTLDSVKISQPDGAPGGNPTYTTPDHGVVIMTNGPTPTLSRTWGKLKALYR
jgi:hypothetical protein